jgi:predicted ATPase
MKLNYLWIKDYKNIQDQEFNFGSEFKYSLLSVKHTDGFFLNREKNDLYINNFFKIDGKGFENVTALVGDNGSGKSNILSYLRGVLSNDHTFYDFGDKKISSEFIAIFTSDIDKDNKPIILSHIADEQNLFINFEHKILGQVPYYIESIFYSPVYDFSIYPINYTDSSDIDVSSNFLIYKDFEQQESGFDTLNQIEYHKFQNVSRQIDFVLAHLNSSDLLKIISLPREINLHIHQNSVEGENTDSFKFHNTPYEFRPFFDIGLRKFRKELNATSNKELYARKKGNITSYIDLKYHKTYLFFLWSLWRNLIANIEKSNRFLEEGEINMEENEFHDLDFENCIIHFINNQNIFKNKPIIQLITTFKSLRNTHKSLDDNKSDYKIISTSLSVIQKVRFAYLNYLNSMYAPAGNSTPYEFLSFDWSGLSTGEKAYLDLFSRIYYGGKIILERLRDSETRSYRNTRYPKYIYLLLDEAELGFHLQWQKEYIFKIINAMPLLFGQNTPKLQLIFTTHSPISLSDIPQSNVVFLKKENNNCKVLNTNQMPKHSFGANIHEMLYDAFYLQDGFIGNFAQYKIQKAIDWCNNKQVDIATEEVQHIISIIDDPIVKVKLTEMFANKVGLNIERERLRAQQAYIQKRLNELGDND